MSIDFYFSNMNVPLRYSYRDTYNIELVPLSNTKVPHDNFFKTDDNIAGVDIGLYSEGYKPVPILDSAPYFLTSSKYRDAFRNKLFIKKDDKLIVQRYAIPGYAPLGDLIFDSDYYLSHPDEISFNYGEGIKLKLERYAIAYNKYNWRVINWSGSKTLCDLGSKKLITVVLVGGGGGGGGGAGAKSSSVNWVFDWDNKDSAAAGGGGGGAGAITVGVLDLSKCPSECNTIEILVGQGGNGGIGAGSGGSSNANQYAGIGSGGMKTYIRYFNGGDQSKTNSWELSAIGGSGGGGGAAGKDVCTAGNGGAGGNSSSFWYTYYGYNITSNSMPVIAAKSFAGGSGGTGGDEGAGANGSNQDTLYSDVWTVGGEAIKIKSATTGGRGGTTGYNDNGSAKASGGGGGAGYGNGGNGGDGSAIGAGGSSGAGGGGGGAYGNNSAFDSAGDGYMGNSGGFGRFLIYY